MLHRTVASLLGLLFTIFLSPLKYRMKWRKMMISVNCVQCVKKKMLCIRKNGITFLRYVQLMEEHSMVDTWQGVSKHNYCENTSNTHNIFSTEV